MKAITDKNKVTLIFSMLLTIILLSSCFDKENDFDASGTFESTEVIVSSEANGRILKFDVAEGKELKEGQIVGNIDSIQLYLRKKQLLANIKAVRSNLPETGKQLAGIEQQILTQKKEKQRIETLLKSNAANQKQLDDINAQILYLEKQYDAQLSTLSNTSKRIYEEISALELQVEQLNDQLSKCRIPNPIKGTVIVSYAQVGELAVQSKALYKVADLENMILRAYITAEQFSKIKIGQKVNVFIDYGEDEYKQYTGEISWCSSKAEFTPKTIQTKSERANLVYAIKVSVKNDGLIKIGMYGELSFDK